MEIERSNHSRHRPKTQLIYKSPLTEELQVTFETDSEWKKTVGGVNPNDSEKTTEIKSDKNVRELLDSIKKHLNEYDEINNKSNDYEKIVNNINSDHVKVANNNMQLSHFVEILCSENANTTIEGFIEYNEKSGKKEDSLMLKHYYNVCGDICLAVDYITKNFNNNPKLFDGRIIFINNLRNCSQAILSALQRMFDKSDGNKIFIKGAMEANYNLAILHTKLTKNLASMYGKNDINTLQKTYDEFRKAIDENTTLYNEMKNKYSDFFKSEMSKDLPKEADKIIDQLNDKTKELIKMKNEMDTKFKKIDSSDKNFSFVPNKIKHILGNLDKILTTKK